MIFMKILPFTPIIHHPVSQTGIPAPHKEVEPRLDQSKPVEIARPLPEEDILQEEKELYEAEAVSETVVIPDNPALDQDLKALGVSTPNDNFVILGNKKIELPLSPAELKAGETKPLTSGVRWIAELTKYILRKLNLTIKKVGQVLKYAPLN
jgi:hypothetical protein